MLSLKRKATLEEREQFKIKEECYIIDLFKVIEERCDELDNEIDEEGYEIIHQEYTRVATSIYNYQVFFK